MGHKPDPRVDRDADFKGAPRDPEVLARTIMVGACRLDRRADVYRIRLLIFGKVEECEAGQPYVAWQMAQARVVNALSALERAAIGREVPS